VSACAFRTPPSFPPTDPTRRPTPPADRPQALAATVRPVCVANSPTGARLAFVEVRRPDIDLNHSAARQTDRPDSVCLTNPGVPKPSVHGRRINPRFECTHADTSNLNVLFSVRGRRTPTGSRLSPPSVLVPKGCPPRELECFFLSHVFILERTARSVFPAIRLFASKAIISHCRLLMKRVCVISAWTRLWILQGLLLEPMLPTHLREMRVFDPSLINHTVSSAPLPRRPPPRAEPPSCSRNDPSLAALRVVRECAMCVRE
jgi:hypothetical protein